MAVWPLFNTISNQFIFGFTLLLTSACLITLDRVARLSLSSNKPAQTNLLILGEFLTFTRTGLRSALYVLFLLLLTSHLAVGSEQTNQVGDTHLIADQYRRILRLEHQLRRPQSAPPDIRKLSSLIDGYLGIANNHPHSEYASRALWQAAGISILLYDAYHDERHRKQTVKLLTRLDHDFQDSQVSSQISTRLQRVRTPKERANNVGVLLELKQQQIGTTTRVIIALDSERPVYTRDSEHPRLFRIDLRDVSLASRLDPEISPMPVANITKISTTEHDGFTRVSLELKEKVNCHTFEFYDPFRVLVDCRQAAPQTAQSLAFPQRTLDDGRPNALENTADLTASIFTKPTYNGSDSMIPLVRQLGLGVSRVVIDPGHGGRDPGASANGLLESELTLDIAERLSGRLADYGIEAVLTRTSDKYLSLETRTDLANSVETDLFLSLHFNASFRPDTSGIETYILDFATTEDAEEAARRENRLSTKTFTDLDSLVTAISKTTKKAESNILANALQTGLVDKLRTVNPELPNLGVKSAPFLVLVGVQAPSVLAELSFVSNIRDARLLKSDHYRALISEGLLEGVLRYSQDLKIDQRAVAPSNIERVD